MAVWLRPCSLHLLVWGWSLTALCCVAPELAGNAPRSAQANGCHFTLGPGVSTVYGQENYGALKAGSVVCIPAGSRGRLVLKNLRGEPGNPITFVNFGGEVEISSSGFAGIRIANSEHIRITGAGVSGRCGAAFAASEQQCGFRITAPAGRGIAGASATRYIEIDHVEIYATAYSAITINTTYEKDGVRRANFTQYNTFLHHNYAHNIGKEGFYIGSSHYTAGGDDPVLRGVDIHHNLVADTGWDGIQVGSAVEDCAVHHNRIYRDSLANVELQRSGIMINRGSVCDVYANFVKDGFAAYGIYVQGNGGNRIYNNVVVNRTKNSGRGITVATGSNVGRGICVSHNTLVSIEGQGISFRNVAGAGNFIESNLLADVRGEQVYVGVASATHNSSLTSVEEAKFADPPGDDYSLAVGSPAIDAALPVSQCGVVDDYAGTLRPQGAAPDIGAYEFIADSARTLPHLRSLKNGVFIAFDRPPQ